MSEYETLFKGISTQGVPLIICAAVILLAVKYIPKFLDGYLAAVETKNESDEKSRQEQREYYNCRQKQYDEQSQVMNTMMKTITAVAERSNIIIENNTQAIERNTKVNENHQRFYSKISDSMEDYNTKLQDLKEDSKEHDRLCQKVYTGITRVEMKLNK
ncbi:hypothetical protein [Sinanaerobacter chloroacetimidivorans]|uniref:Uncharacterized protein n=1 Tax=Sinanaerobacter chloroacetimidivorans TaxID=2818044 RepID=A0A8J8B095_9FIRM|nr:hypothetical protein [Sinanaerobacter chloroacetimidivorans]MBR0596964.1 hypothetical protein [Sinanaerobacter chloroacetimidivorans]